MILVVSCSFLAPPYEWRPSSSPRTTIRRSHRQTRPFLLGRRIWWGTGHGTSAWRATLSMSGVLSGGIRSFKLRRDLLKCLYLNLRPNTESLPCCVVLHGSRKTHPSIYVRPRSARDSSGVRKDVVWEICAEWRRARHRPRRLAYRRPGSASLSTPERERRVPPKK
jgi:hypothetical protein